MKKYLVLAVGILLSVASFGKTYQVGITQIMEHSALDETRIGFEKALKDSGLDIKIDFQNAQNDMTTQQLIASQFVSKKKDLILAISTTSVQSIMSVDKNLAIPLLFAAIADPKNAGFVRKGMTGTSHGIPLEKQIASIKAGLPKVKKIGILYNPAEKNSEIITESVKKEAPKHGLEVVTVGISNPNEIPSGMDTLLKKVDLIYMTTDNITTAGFPIILKKANTANIPVVAAIAEQVKAGAVFGNVVNFEKLGYQTGEMAVKILKGANIDSIPFETAKNIELLINDEAAKKFNVNLTNLKK